METQKTHFQALQRQVITDQVQATSAVPILGPWIVRVRNSWNTLLAKWRLARRQDQVNSTLVDEIWQQAIRVDQEAEIVAHLDKELATSRRESAVLSAQNHQMQKRIHALEARIAELEKQIGRAS